MIECKNCEHPEKEHMNYNRNRMCNHTPKYCDCWWFEKYD